MNKKLFGSAMLLLAAIIWGFGFTMQSISAQNLPTFTVVAIKNFGGFLLIPIALLLKQKFTKEVFIGGIACGLLQTLACLSQQKGIELSTVGKSSFITALYIVFTPLLSVLIGKKIKKTIWLGVGVAALGMYLLCMKESLSLSTGDIYLLVCAICLAGQILVIDKYVTVADPIPLSSIQAITVFVISFIGTLFEQPSFEVIKNTWYASLYACVLSCAVACTLQMVYQKDVEPNLAGLLMSFESVFGALGGFLFLHELLTIRELMGCVLIFIAVLIAQK